MIAASFIQDLLSRTDIVEVIGPHVALRKGGANLMGLCPFHGEKSPSFSVSTAKQFYHCFGCGVSGDAIRFLTDFCGTTFVDAVHELAQRAGIPVPQDEATPAEREQAAAQKQRRATLGDVLVRAADHYRKQLRANQRAIDYLKGRGLNGEVAARFGLGYAPDGWRSLASAFAHYDDPLLEESGLVIAHDAESGLEADRKRYDRFRDRIMFPIRSVQGEVIGFGGRVLDRGEPKYLNSPETPLFSKGRELYGLFEARTGLRQRGYALVVEGYMDVVALAQSGLGNAVATLGTACTADHVQKLFRFTDSVVFSFDGDKAGRRAAARALEASLPFATDTRTVRFLFLPPEHDPDSYIREHGAAAFEARVAEAVPLSRQIVELASESQDLATAEGRAHFLAAAKPHWSALPDGVLKRQLLDALADVGRMPADELSSMWIEASRSRSREPAPGITSRAPLQRARPVSRSAANLLDRAVWLLLQRCEMWDTLDGGVHDLLAAQATPYDFFFRCIEQTLHEHGALAPTALIAELTKRAGAEGRGIDVIARISQFHAPEPQADLAAELALLVDRLRLQAIEDELKLLFESGARSPDAHARSRQLIDAQARLKAEFARKQRAAI